MTIDYSHKVAHLPWLSNLEKTSTGVVGSAIVKGNPVYYLGREDGNYRIPEPFYRLFKGDYETTFHEDRGIYEIFCYNGIDRIPNTIYSALITSFLESSLPDHQKAKYMRIYELILEGTLNVKSCIYPKKDGSREEREPCKPLIEIREVHGDVNMNAEEDWLNSLKGRPYNKRDYMAEYYETHKEKWAARKGYNRAYYLSHKDRWKKK